MTFILASPYCTGLHGQLARMSGLVLLLLQDNTNLPEVKYAKAFAVEVGHVDQLSLLHSIHL